MVYEPVMTILEKAYFHTGNSGLTITLEADDEPKFSINAMLHAFGTQLRVRIPLETPECATWLGNALLRVGAHMENLKGMNRLGWTSMSPADVQVTGVEPPQGLKSEAPPEAPGPSNG